MTVVLFDIDGTIVTKSTTSATSKQLAYTRAIESVYGICNLNYMDYPIFGLTDLGILWLLLRENGLEDDDIQQGQHQFIESMLDIHETLAQDREQQYKALPGAFTFLETLISKDIPLGLATGNLETLGWFKLKEAGLDQFFEFGGWGEDGTDRADIVKAAMERSHETDPRKIVLFGDTLHDLDAARRNGIHGRAVATGRFTVQELRERANAPHHVIQGMTDLDSLMKMIP